MDDNDSKTKLISPKSVTVTKSTTWSDTVHVRRRMVQSFLLIWADANIDQSNTCYQNTLAQLRSVVNEVNIFTQPDDCVEFLMNFGGMKAFLILEESLGEQIVPRIHDIPQLDTIYIFGVGKPRDEQWTKEWVKVKGVYTAIAPICECLQQDVKQYNQDSIAVSFVTVNEETSKQNVNQLEASFMYTQLLKEILLGMQYNEKSVKDFINFCSNGDYGSPNNITRFEKEYNAKLAIWWYTFPSFIYSMLNGALRILQADTIINMGFFICDLHHQIEELHRKQISSYGGKSFVIYRGQGLSTTDFEKLQKTQGGLISFNNFLSTSRDKEVSLGFAQVALTKPNTVGILFEMTIDPSVSSAPFGSTEGMGYFQAEEEILFSMHTVFCIGEIKQIDNSSTLYQVDLKLTSDDDEQLRTLTNRIREETPGETGWQRLSLLLVKIGQFNKAKELYQVLLEQTSDRSEIAIYHNNLGSVMDNQGDYENAIWYYEQALEVWQKTLPLNDSNLIVSYNNIGGVYKNMGEYSKALSFYEKACEICEKMLPANDPDLAISYNNMGGVYDNMGEYSKALSFYEKACEIFKKTHPANHPEVATSFNNVGLVYSNIGEYSKALSFYEKALDICQKTLPSNHPSLAISYGNIGTMYMNMGEYSKALSSYEQVVAIQQNALSANHPSLATSYNNIGGVYQKMGEYSKALSFYDKALEIRQNTLSPNHPLLGASYNNIGGVYDNMGEYPKALSFYEKDLEILKESLPPNHSDLAQSYNNIGSVYYNMGEYPKALSFYEKAFDIYQKTLSSDHPDLATCFNNMGGVYINLKDYSKALSLCEKALEIRQRTLSSNHPSLATSYGNVGMVYMNIQEYSKALLCHEKALEIQQSTLPADHPELATTYNNIAGLYFSMKQYSKALLYFERALNIFQHCLPSNHPYLQTVSASIYFVKKKLQTNVS
ncbi:unnamed protein product [Rotaria sp. Silwood2]|nr:unnamed protein product [Rotaria sp. Silwood2]